MLNGMGSDGADNRASLEDLEVEFAREFHTDKRAAAEIAYALAFRYRNEDIGGKRRFDVAKSWALQAIDILTSLPSETIAQVMSIHTCVGGVPIPDLLHAGVVRERLLDVLA